MGLITAFVIIVIAVGVAEFIQKKQNDYKNHPYYRYITPYINNRCNIVLGIIMLLLIML